MSFSEDFKACMRPLPTPSEVLDGVGEVLEFIEKLHHALEASGGDTEIALGAIALKLNTRLEWDAEKAKISNNSEANELLKPVVRKGWHIG